MQRSAVVSQPGMETPAGRSHSWSGREAADSLRRFGEKQLIAPTRTLLLSADMREEAVQLAHLGHRILAVDTDAQRLKKLGTELRRERLAVDLVAADFLAMPPALCGPVELVVDRLFVHGVPPLQRPAWADKVARVLPAGGRLAGLFYIGRAEEGPPYPMTVDILRKLTSRAFITTLLEPVGPPVPGLARAYRALFQRK